MLENGEDDLVSLSKAFAEGLGQKNSTRRWCRRSIRPPVAKPHQETVQHRRARPRTRLAPLGRACRPRHRHSHVGSCQTSGAQRSPLPAFAPSRRCRDSAGPRIGPGKLTPDRRRIRQKCSVRSQTHGRIVRTSRSRCLSSVRIAWRNHYTSMSEPFAPRMVRWSETPERIFDFISRPSCDMVMDARTRQPKTAAALLSAI